MKVLTAAAVKPYGDTAPKLPGPRIYRVVRTNRSTVAPMRFTTTTTTTDRAEFSQLPDQRR
jgi:hypothetical protein